MDSTNKIKQSKQAINKHHKHHKHNSTPTRIKITRVRMPRHQTRHTEENRQYILHTPQIPLILVTSPMNFIAAIAQTAYQLHQVLPKG